MMWRATLLAALLNSGAGVAHAACAVAYAASEAAYDEADVTAALIAYISELVEKNILAIHVLERLISAIENNGAPIIISEVESETDSELQVHRPSLEEYLNDPRLDRNLLLRGIQQYVQSRTMLHQRRGVAREDTALMFRRMQLFPVPAGEMLRTRGIDITPIVEPVVITSPFLLADTQVTQWQWLEIMGHNPSELPQHALDLEDLPLEIQFRGQRHELQPNHPVNKINWWDAIKFAHALSELHGFEPAHALDGTIIPHANGYRIPTYDEQDYIFTIAKSEDGRSYLDAFDEKPHDFAWCAAPAVRSSCIPVATRQAAFIDGNRFYDLLGNVEEWGISVSNPSSSAQRGAGGSWFRSFSQAKPSTNSWQCYGKWERTPHVGLRLVRSIVE